MDMKQFSLTKHDPELLKLINQTEHKTLAIWAINCLDRVLPIYISKYPDEATPQNAIKILKLWINDEVNMWEARKYCWVVLKLAREIEKQDKVSCQILRATSHCLATCHVPTHSEGTAMYIVSAIQHLNKDNPNVLELMNNERIWQIEHLLELQTS